MREEGKIDEAALRPRWPSRSRPGRAAEERTNAPHFVDFVKSELAERYGEKLKTEGLQIYTTLDVDLQQAAQRAVTQGLETLEKNYRRLAAASKEAPLQGALIVLEPQTGSVRAFVGGRDYRLSQFNRVTQAHRQPGSLFKPFVYLAAFARRDLRPAGHAGDDPRGLADHRRVGTKTEDEHWTPRNYDGEYRGPMSARRAVELSINIPTVRVVAAGGPAVRRSRAARAARDRLAAARLSLGRARAPSRSRRMEIAGAYAVLANSGVRVAPIAIVGVMTGDGRVLDRKETPLAPALPADAVFLVDSILRGRRRPRHGGRRARAAGCAACSPARPARPTTGATPGSSASRRDSSRPSGSATTTTAA